MKCFYHRDRDAVGLCKSCGRGLCAECAADLGKALACAGKCEEDVAACVRYVETNLRMSPAMSALARRTRGTHVTSAAFTVAIGAAIIGVGIWLDGGVVLGLPSVIGAMFVIWGLAQLARALMMPRFPVYDEESDGTTPTQKGY